MVLCCRRNKPQIKPLNLGVLAQAIAEGRIDVSLPVDMKCIYDAQLVGKITDGGKLLSKVCTHFSPEFGWRDSIY